MLLGEMLLLVVAVLVMIGAIKRITARLGLNDYVTTFLIFVIVLLNARGGIRLSDRYSLYLGGVLSVIVAIWILLIRSERFSDVILAFFSALGSAGIAFSYTMHFSAFTFIDPRLLAVLLSLLIGLWAACSARRTFSSCLFSATAGVFLGVTLYQTIVRMRGNIGGSYCFTLMWFGAIFGILIQYLLTYMMQAVKSPRGNIYFEASEMADEKENVKTR